MSNIEEKLFSSDVPKEGLITPQPKTPRTSDSASTFEEDETSEVSNTRSSESTIESAFLEQLISSINIEDVDKINQNQKNMLNRFEKTNEMLVNVNALGQIHYEKLSRDYRKHTSRLVEMHKDLDWIFHRVRFLKQKLAQKYPDVKIDKSNSKNLADEEEEEEKENQRQNAEIKTEEKPENTQKSSEPSMPQTQHSSPTSETPSAEHQQQQTS